MFQLSQAPGLQDLLHRPDGWLKRCLDLDGPIKWFTWGFNGYLHLLMDIYLMLVCGSNPSEKYESQWEGLFPIYYRKSNSCSKPPNSI